MFVTLALGAGGCGGISASQSVSPASFFVPGLLKNDSAPKINAPVAFIPRSNDLAFAK